MKSGVSLQFDALPLIARLIGRLIARLIAMRAYPLFIFFRDWKFEVNRSLERLKKR